MGMSPPGAHGLSPQLPITPGSITFIPPKPTLGEQLLGWGQPPDQEPWGRWGGALALCAPRPGEPGRLLEQLKSCRESRRLAPACGEEKYWTRGRREG